MGNKKEERFGQLINDIAEGMNMGHWTRRDLIDCISYQQDRICALTIQLTMANDAELLRQLNSVIETRPTFSQGWGKAPLKPKVKR